MRHFLEAALIAGLALHTQPALAQSDATGAPAQQTPAAAAQGAGDGSDAGASAAQQSAQPRNGGVSQQTLEERIRQVGGIPGGVVDAAIDGKGREAYRVIGEYLADGNAVPGTRVARSVAVIRQAATDSRIEGQ